MAEKRKRIPVDELTRLAFVHAECDVEGLVEAHARCAPELRQQYEHLLQQLRAYRLKRWGKTGFEAATENAKTINVYEAATAPPGEFKAMFGVPHK